MYLLAHTYRYCGEAERAEWKAGGLAAVVDRDHGISHAPAEHCRIGQVRACGAGLQLREAGLMQVLVVAGAIWRGGPH
jgi:hypothetical protein